MLVLPIKIFRKNQSVVYEGSFGFAFSGSTLVANSLYAFVSSALQSLRLDDESLLPTLEDVAIFDGICLL